VNVRGRLVAGLESNADDLLEPGLEEGLEPGLEPGLEGRVEFGLEPGAEPGPESGLEPGLGELEPAQGLVGAELGPPHKQPGRDKSGAANSCYPSGTGQNGPIVDINEEHGWPTAGIAAMAHGA